MKVIDHQHLAPRAVPGRRPGRQGHRQRLRRRRSTVAGRPPHIGLAARPAQSFDDGGDKPGWVSVGHVTAQPRHWSLRASNDPVGRSAVLPAPGEPTSRVSRAPCPRSSSSSSLDRCTRCGAARGAQNFDEGTAGYERQARRSPSCSPSSVVLQRHRRPDGEPLSRWSLPAANVYCETISPIEGGDKARRGASTLGGYERRWLID